MSLKSGLLIVLGLVLGCPAWYLVTIQLKYVSTPESLCYRFLIAAAFLEVIRMVLKIDPPKSLSPKVWTLIFLESIALFGINFWLCYEASKYMISGLIPALPAIIFVPAMLIERMRGEAVTPTKVVGSIIALSGIYLVFREEISGVDSSQAFGLFLVFISIFFTLGGSQIARTLVQKEKIPIIWLTSRALLIGGLFFLPIIVFGNGISSMSFESEFLLSLVYLGVFVTGITFLLHAYLIKNYGVSQASFLWTLVPVACLSVSALFEGYVFTLTSVIGLGCIILGAVLYYGFVGLKIFTVKLT